MFNKFPFELPLREINTSFIIWGWYIILQALYCTFHAIIVNTHPLDVQDLLIWAISEWNIWILITPFVFIALSRYETSVTSHMLLYPAVIVVTVAWAISFRIGIDYYAGTRDIISSVSTFLPRYLAALLLIILIWHLFLHTKPSKKKRSSSGDNKEQEKGEEGKYSKLILVSKGNEESLINVNSIQYINAAGNYVEIYSDNQLYLMRTTMMQIERSLPPFLFLRIHRSHIVNINEIDRIKTRPSGNGSVQLHSGKKLNVSKKYKSQLQKYQLD